MLKMNELVCIMVVCMQCVLMVVVMVVVPACAHLSFIVHEEPSSLVLHSPRGKARQGEVRETTTVLVLFPLSFPYLLLPSASLPVLTVRQLLAGTMEQWRIYTRIDA